jgi:DNA (cytosine-5)-methyltransferase 1
MQSHHAQTFILQGEDMAMQETMIYSPADFSNYAEGVGTLKAGMTNNNSPIAVDTYNNAVSEVHQTLRANGIESTGVFTSIVHRLTPVECERLQGFPDGWTEGQSDSQRYKQMGNAVAVPVVSWIIDRLLEASID